MQSSIINGISVTTIDRAEQIQNARDMLDLMANAQYLYDSNCLIVYQESLPDAFFDLKTKLAGEILQKFSNYSMRLAIVGDFSGYQSKALRDFIRECNRGRQIFWVDTPDAALHALTSV